MSGEAEENQEEEEGDRKIGVEGARIRVGLVAVIVGEEVVG